MATTTLPAARQEFSRRLQGTTPGYASFNTTTNIAANTSVISTALPNAGYTQDDYFGPDNAWWIIITSGDNSGVIRRITDYTGSTGTLTVSGAALAAESVAVSFELHRYHPTILRQVLNDASRDAWPLLHIPVINESMFTVADVRRYPLPSPWTISAGIDPVKALRQVRLFRSPFADSYSENVLSNGGFASWSGGAPSSWTATNLTVTQEQATTSPRNYAVLSDSSSAKCAATASTAGDLTQTISSPSTYDGRSFACIVWVYSTTSARVFARLTLNASTTDSANHSGTGWEPLIVRGEATVALTTLSLGVRVSSGTAIIFFADEAIMLAGPYWPPFGEDEPLLGWTIESQYTASPGQISSHYLVVPGRLLDRYQFRLVGTDYLTQLTATETDTVEIGTPQTDLWYAYARRRMGLVLMAGSAPEREYGTVLVAEADREILQYRQHRVPEPPLLKLPYALGR